MVAYVCMWGGGATCRNQPDKCSFREEKISTAEVCGPKVCDRPRVKRQKARELSSAGRQVGVTRS